MDEKPGSVRVLIGVLWIEVILTGLTVVGLMAWNVWTWNQEDGDSGDLVGAAVAAALFLAGWALAGMLAVRGALRLVRDRRPATPQVVVTGHVVVVVLGVLAGLWDLDRCTAGFLAVVAALGVAASAAALTPGSRGWFRPEVTAAAH